MPSKEAFRGNVRHPTETEARGSVRACGIELPHDLPLTPCWTAEGLEGYTVRFHTTEITPVVVPHNFEPYVGAYVLVVALFIAPTEMGATG